MVGLRLDTAAVFAGLALGAAGPVGAFSQRGPEPLFRAGTELVEVDVAVRDARSGRPIQGLRREDFSVFENGRRQAVRYFGVLKPTPRARQSDERPAEQKGTFRNRASLSDAANVVAILIDGLNARFEDPHYALRGALEALREVQTPGRVGVYSLTRLGLRVLHHYGENVESLAAILKKGPPLWDSQRDSGPDPDAPGAIRPKAPDENRELVARIRLLDTLQALRWIAQHLRHVPGAKRIIWLSAGFPMSIATKNLADWNKAMEDISDCNVAVHAIDSSGLRTIPGFSAERPTTRTLPVRPPGTSRANADNDVLKDAAFRTGGLAFENTNDLRSAVDAALRDSDCVYRLAYTPVRDDRDGRFVPIKVKVNRRGVRVGHRAGYYAVAETPVAAADRERILLDAISSPVDATGIGLIVQLTALGNPENSDEFTVLTVADPSSVALRREALGYTGGFDIRYSQKTSVGALVYDSTDEVSLALTQAQYERIKTDGFVYSKRLAQAPGATTLKVIVCDQLTGVVGSISIPFAPVRRD